MMTPTELEKRPLVACVLISLIFLMSDAVAATTVELQIKLEDGAAVPQLADVVFRWEDVVLAKGVFDAKGWLRQEFDFKPGSGVREVIAEIRRSPHASEKLHFTISPGDALGFDLKLPSRKLTTLRLFDAKGKPAANYGFSLEGAQGPQYADEKGEFHLSLGQLAPPPAVAFLGHTHHFFNAVDVQEIRRPAYSFLPGIDFFDFSWSSNLGTHAERPARLRGRLLLHDDRPAKVWHIATGVSRGGGWTPIWGGGMSSSLTHYDVHYLDLVEVGVDGRFDLFPASRDLVVISPQGIVLRYPLNPEAWGENAEKETSIKLPEIERRKVHLRYRGGNGEPDEVASNVRVQFGQLGSAWDIWKLRPTLFDQGVGRIYADRKASPELDSILPLAKSDAEGEIDLPVHPWQSSGRIIWLAGEGQGGTASVSGIGKENSVLILKKSEPKSEAINFLQATYRFHDSAGKPVDPRSVRWETRFGEGRFLPAQKEARLVYRKYQKQVIFTHKTEAGKIERFTHRIDPESAGTVMTVDAKFTALEDIPAEVQSLRGTVLTHAGEPAPDLRLHLVENIDGPDRRFTQLTSITDADGRYSFATAPAECDFYFSVMWEGRMVSVEDIVDPPKVTAARRDIDFKLHPTGSIEVKLVGAKHLPKELILLSKEEGRKEVRLRGSRRDSMTFFSPYVRSGEYDLVYRCKKHTGKLQQVIVKPGEENRFEVEADKVMREGMESSEPKPIRIAVSVVRDGKKVSGALVYSASTKVKGSETFPSRPHLLMTSGDLSDTAGRAHFLLSPGSYHFAARDGHGHVGWSEVEITAAASDVEIELQPLREVVAQLPEVDPNAKPAAAPRGAQLALQLMGVHKRPK